MSPPFEPTNLTYSIGLPTLISGFYYTVPSDQYFNFTVHSNNQFRSNLGASVVRLNDRVLIGAAANNDAASPNVEKDWLTDLIPWPVYNSTASIVSKYGTIALAVGSRTSDLDPIEANTRETTIGVAAFAISDNLGSGANNFFASYGFYSEAITYPNTISNSFGAEFEAINRTTVPAETPTPYKELFTASVQALRLGSGGGQPNLGPISTALSALAIVPNGNTFNVGIVFEKGALTGADGNTGFGTAIAMGKGHMVSWYAPSSNTGALSAFITSTIANSSNKVSIQAQDGGWLFIQPNDTIGFSVQTRQNTENGITIIPSEKYVDPNIKAFGEELDVNLGISAQGNGYITTNSTIYPNNSLVTVMRLLNNQNIIWYNSFGHQSSALNNQRTANTIVSFQFDNQGLSLYAENSLQASITEVSNAVNYPSLVPATSLSAAGIYAQGTGNNKNLALYARDGGKLEIKSSSQNTASSGSGQLTPTNVVKYLQITLNDGLTTNTYAIPLYGT